MTTFKDLGLSEPLLKAIEQFGFDAPSGIQIKTIPPILDRKDVIAQSATGSGKTLAFGLGIIQNVKCGHGIQALILTPTRELAVQVGGVIRDLSRNHPHKVSVVYGGVSINPQIKALREANIVVGTPGRVLDHLERKTMNLSKVSLVVLDEADRMLDMGFIHDVSKIIRQCPAERQTLLFSATIQPELGHLAQRYMKSPLRISAKLLVDSDKMSEVYYDVNGKMKLALLVHLLKKEKKDLVMVFCNTRRSADLVAKSLRPQGVEASSIHGGLSQAKRSQILRNFHSQKINVLVCTDVAARGLDIRGISHIYNFDIPKDGKEYIHRIGRTARAGKEGKIVNLLSNRDYDSFSFILRDTGKEIRKIDTPHVEPIRIDWEHSRHSYGRAGHSSRPTRHGSARYRSRYHKPRNNFRLR